MRHTAAPKVTAAKEDMVERWKDGGVIFFFNFILERLLQGWRAGMGGLGNE